MSMKIKMKSFYLNLTIFLALAALSFANDSMLIINPKMSYPSISKTEDISMIKEIVIYSNEMVYTTFWFSNHTDKEIDITLGFPVKGFFRYNGPDELDFIDGEKPPLSNIISLIKTSITNHFKFQTFVNGVKKKRNIYVNYSEDREKIETTFTLPIKFKPHELIIVSNIYKSEPDSFSGQAVYEWNKIEYIWTTAKSWKNGIENGYLEFNIPFYKDHTNGLNHRFFKANNFIIKSFGIFYLRIKPEGFKIITNENRWTIIFNVTNYFPDEEIKIEWGYDEISNFNFLNLAKDSATKEDFSIFKNTSPEIYNNFQNPQALLSFIYEFKSYMSENPDYKLGKYDIDFIFYSIDALNGKLTNEKWNLFFKNFDWYKKSTFSIKEKIKSEIKENYNLIKENYNFQLLVDEGVELYKNKKEAKAIKKFQEAEKLGESGELFYFYANSLMNLKRYDEAISYYKKGIEKKFNTHLCYYNIACAYSLKNDLKNARIFLKQAVKAGYNNFKHIENDPDLNLSLRKDSKFLKDLRKTYNFHYNSEYRNHIKIIISIALIAIFFLVMIASFFIESINLSIKLITPIPFFLIVFISILQKFSTPEIISIIITLISFLFYYGSLPFLFLVFLIKNWKEINTIEKILYIFVISGICVSFYLIFLLQNFI